MSTALISLSLSFFQQSADHPKHNMLRLASLYTSSVRGLKASETAAAAALDATLAHEKRAMDKNWHINHPSQIMAKVSNEKIIIWSTQHQPLCGRTCGRTECVQRTSSTFKPSMHASRYI